MATKDDGGPAFPVHDLSGYGIAMTQTYLDISSAALAWEIWAWPDLDDFEGVIVHLLRCGYSITAIGVTRLDALIDEARAARVCCQ